MDMSIDEAWYQSGSGPGDNGYICIRYIVADVLDDAFFNQYISVFEDMLAGKDSNVFKHEGSHFRITWEDEIMGVGKALREGCHVLRNAKLTTC